MPASVSPSHCGVRVSVYVVDAERPVMRYGLATFVNDSVLPPPCGVTVRLAVPLPLLLQCSVSSSLARWLTHRPLTEQRSTVISSRYILCAVPVCMGCDIRNASLSPLPV